MALPHLIWEYKGQYFAILSLHHFLQCHQILCSNHARVLTPCPGLYTLFLPPGLPNLLSSPLLFGLSDNS